MKKTERINVMMRYINNRAFFTLSELMVEFDISRSTALRNVQEIEALGMPLEASVGRDGGFVVHQNTLLPAVRFTTTEVKALFTAFMASQNLQLPYLTSRQSLTEKLLGLIPQTEQDSLLDLNALLVFEGTNAQATGLLELFDLPAPMLEQLIALALNSRQIMVTHAGKTEQWYLLKLYRSAEQWLMAGINGTTAQQQILPVADLTSVAAVAESAQWSPAQVRRLKQRAQPAVRLAATLGPAAIAQFRQYHPVGTQLAYLDSFQHQATLTVTQYQSAETLVNWLLFLGPACSLTAAEPQLMQALRERIGALTKPIKPES